MRRRLLISTLMPLLLAGCQGEQGDPSPVAPADGGALPFDDASPTMSWLSVSAGGAHTCAVRSDNTAWCWGSNSNGQLGDGTAQSSPTPVRVRKLAGVTRIAADWVHSCAVMDNGHAFCWGENDGMQLGDPMAETNHAGCNSGGCTEPIRVVKLAGVAGVGTGSRHSCAVMGGGALWCWGFNELGQLGNGKMPFDSASPAQVTGLANAASVSGGPWHTCAAAKDGRAYCWGDNADGNLGVSSPTESDKPIQVPGLLDVAAVVAGDLHSCARTQAGAAYCFGANAAGQLGTGTTQGSSTPNKLQGPSGVRSISAAVDHSCAVDGAGDVWCWGSNGTDTDSDGAPDTVNGKLGQDTSVQNRLKPNRVGGVTQAASVTTGDDHTCALTATGEIWCWGSNEDGQLGVAGLSSAQPVQVAVPDQM